MTTGACGGKAGRQPFAQCHKGINLGHDPVWFGEKITRRQIRRGTHRSTQALETAIKEYLAVYNEDPKPFVWTKTAEQILGIAEALLLTYF